MAGARGDVAHHVGDERAASGGKLGDVVIELEAGQGECRGRIALEVKDEKLSKNKAWEVLNGSLAERDASFAILVRRLRGARCPRVASRCTSTRATR